MKKLKAVKEFVIDRSKWHTGAARLRGDVYIDSALHVPTNNRMCCLGFFGAACGLPKKKMSNNGYLSDLSHDIVFAGATYTVENVRLEEFFEEQLPSVLQKDLAKLNDDDALILPDKEKMIKHVFAKRGIKVKFIGKLLP